MIIIHNDYFCSSQKPCKKSWDLDGHAFSEASATRNMEESQAGDDGFLEGFC